MTELNILLARYIATIANYYYLCANDYKILDYQNIFQKKFYLIIYKQCVCMFKNIKKIIKNNYKKNFIHHNNFF